MKRWAICYVSSASPFLKCENVDGILSFTKAWNIDHNVTGILLYSEGNFFQVLEGETTLIKDLFNNIYNDPRHRNLIKIFDKQIQSTSFTYYETGFLSKRSKHLHGEISYLNYIKTLDPASQNVVRNILKVFV